MTEEDNEDEEVDKVDEVLVDLVDASEDSFVNPFVIFLGRPFVSRIPPPQKNLLITRRVVLWIRLL